MRSTMTNLAQSMPRKPLDRSEQVSRRLVNVGQTQLSPWKLAAFFSKVNVRTAGCWTWASSLNGTGYGVYQGDMAHRLIYLWFVGEIPDGWQVDHLCRNRSCVNPDHLEAVERSVNIRRAFVAVYGNTCKRGHELNAENLRIWKSNRGRTARYCRACRRINRAKGKAA